jgi:hypothetical protein
MPQETAEMIGYFDPDSLQVEDSKGVISFVSAADAADVTEIEITTSRDARNIIAALKDQIEHGIAGSEGRFRKVQGVFTRVRESQNEGIIVEGDKEIPARMSFDVKPGDLPLRGICIAMGEMVEGALMVSRMTLAPIAPIPMPNQGLQTPDS